MNQDLLSEKKTYIPVNVCDVALAIYLCVLYVYQRENPIESVLRYVALALLIVVYMIVYGRSLGIRHDRRLGTIYYVVWAVVFMVYAGLSFFWSIDGSNVLKRLKDVFLPFLACFAVLPRIRSTKSIKNILRVILFSLTYMLIVLVIRTPFSVWGSERVGAEINQHSNAVGRLANLGLLISLYFMTTEKRFRLLHFILIVAFGTCAIMTGSKNALFLMIAEICLYMVLIANKWSRIFVVVGIVACAVFIVNFVMTNKVLYDLLGNRIERMMNWFNGVYWDVDGSTWERLYFIYTAFALFLKHPIIGVGMDNFSAYLKSIAYGNAKYSHCGFLEMLSTLGIIGFIAYYVIYILTLVSLYKPARSRNHLAAMLFTYTVCAVVFDLTTISIYYYPSYLPLMLAFVGGRIFLTVNDQKNLHGKAAVNAARS